MNANPEGFERLPVPVRPLDVEQARFLEILRAAGGRTVTFTELHERGIENPAVLCYELEIAGLPITRVERPHVGGTPAPVGVKLDEKWLNAPIAPEPPRWRDHLRSSADGLVASARVLGSRALGIASRLAARARVRGAGAIALTRSAFVSAEGRLEVAAHRRPQAGASREARLLREARALREGLSTSTRRHPDARRRAEARDAVLGFAASGLAALRRTAGAAATNVRARGAQTIPVTPGRTRTGILVGALALAVVLALALALGSAGGSGSRHSSSAKLANRRHAGYAAHATRAQWDGRSGGRLARRGDGSGSASAGASSRSAPPGGEAESASRATQLQAEGHQLLAEGRYAAAASDLRKAIVASGGSTSRCQEPSSEACIAYAYALYDLGRTLQLQHDPGAAVPILNQRLRIDNQRSTVQAQLRSARKELHSTPRPANPNHHQAGSRDQHPRSGAHPHGYATHPPPASGPEATGEQPQPQSQTQHGAGGEVEGRAPGRSAEEATGPRGGGTPG
jgi:hypothetical protein